MKQSYNINDITLDQEIKKAFDHQLQGIVLTEEKKQALSRLKDTNDRPSALQAFLEKEICIPIVGLPALALSLVLLLTVSYKTLLAPGGVQETNYQTFETQYNHNLYISDRR